METLLKYETHAHTAPVSPCAHLSAEEMIRQVKSAGYDAVVVTDHYTPEYFAGCEEGDNYVRRLHEYFSGYRAAKAEGERIGIHVLPALEMRNIYGKEDYLIYGVDEQQLAEMGCLCFKTLEETLRLVHKCGGILLQAHPFRGYLRCMPAEMMDGVEVVNANPRHDSHNDRALAFGRENGLIRTAGTDVHQDGDAGLAGIFAPFAPDIHAFCQMLQAGGHKCFLKEGDSLRIVE